ncbi:hypothetical protein BsWGS_17470 [Bradybaena similaris]
MSSELVYEASDEASENELLERSLSVWKGWTSIEWEDFAPTALDIHTACSIGHYDWVRSIILKGDNTALDRRNHGGWSPLMYACYIGHENIVSLLINAGCNMDMKNSRGHTPLMLAASCGNEGVARTLVRRGAELELTDKTGWTALFHATYAGHQNFVAFLLEAGANMDAIEPSSGLTPFMEAAAEGHEIIVQLFLQHAVNVNAKAHNGEMARSLALMNGHMKIVSLIDNHVLPWSCLRPSPGLEYYSASSKESPSKKQPPSVHSRRLKSQNPSIRDGPEAIARMIDRTRNKDTLAYQNLLVPKGYMTFPMNGIDKEETRMSYRDVTSPINPEDYKDSSGSRAMSDLEDFNDDSNAFTKTGAITIRSSSSSSGGLVAALGLSREGSLDSDDSHSFEQVATSSDDAVEFPFESNRAKVVSLNGSNVCIDEKPGGRGSSLNGSNVCIDEKPDGRGSSLSPHVSGKENIMPGCNTLQLSLINTINNGYCFVENNCCSLQANSLVASPLQDYFPSHSPLPVDTAAPSDKSQGHQQEPSLPSSSHLVLPKDNMSQVEIVNRFLKNLTVNNPETSTGEHRWAEDTSVTHSAGACPDGIPPPMENLRTTSSEVIPDIRCCSLSRCDDSEVVEYKGTGRMFNEESSTHGNISSPTRDINVSQTDFIEGVPGSFKHTNSAEVQGHQFLRSNANHHQNDPFEHISKQAWAHQPHVNHHQPLHNHRLLNRSPLSHPPRTAAPAGSGRHAAPKMSLTHALPSQPSVKTHTESPQPPLHLPQAYFYSGIEASSHLHQHLYAGTSIEAASSVSASQVNTAASQQDFVTKPLASHCTQSPFVSPYGDSTVGQPQSSVEFQGSLCKLQAPHTQAGQFNHKIPLKQSDSHADHPSPYEPAAADSGNNFPLPPHIAAPQMNPSATVIIPGHSTCQPVSSTIGWDQEEMSRSSGPRDLGEMFSQLGLTKYLDKFEEQDVDLQVFLSMTDNDLKELGVKLFGPRKKMTNAIARWHSSAPIASSSLEQAYADKLEAEMQEMAIQLNQAYESVECLKAQVLQEQQLRSVTEGCLMEERAAWDQGRQVVLNTKSRLRTLGDLMSHLRQYHKELRKRMEQVSRQALARELGDSPQLTSEDRNTAEKFNMENDKKVLSSTDSVSATSGKLLKQSEQCLKEMHKTMVHLLVDAEHLLKSTNTVASVDEGRT